MRKFSSLAGVVLFVVGFAAVAMDAAATRSKVAEILGIDADQVVYAHQAKFAFIKDYLHEPSVGGKMPGGFRTGIYAQTAESIVLLLEKDKQLELVLNLPFADVQQVTTAKWTPLLSRTALGQLQVEFAGNLLAIDCNDKLSQAGGSAKDTEDAYQHLLGAGLTAGESHVWVHEGGPNIVTVYQ